MVLVENRRISAGPEVLAHGGIIMQYGYNMDTNTIQITHLHIWLEKLNESKGIRPTPWLDADASHEA